MNYYCLTVCFVLCLVQCMKPNDAATIESITAKVQALSDTKLSTILEEIELKITDKIHSVGSWLQIIKFDLMNLRFIKETFDDDDDETDSDEIDSDEIDSDEIDSENIEDEEVEDSDIKSNKIDANDLAIEPLVPLPPP